MSSAADSPSPPPPGGNGNGNPNGTRNGRVAKRKGTRSVSSMSPEQLARKRANDREAQRAIRERNKTTISTLTRENQNLGAENGHLRDVVAVLSDTLRQFIPNEDIGRLISSSTRMPSQMASGDGLPPKPADAMTFSTTPSYMTAAPSWPNVTNTVPNAVPNSFSAITPVGSSPGSMSSPGDDYTTATRYPGTSTPNNFVLAMRPATFGGQMQAPTLASGMPGRLEFDDPADFNAPPRLFGGLSTDGLPDSFTPTPPPPQHHVPTFMQAQIYEQQGQQQQQQQGPFDYSDNNSAQQSPYGYQPPPS